MNKEIKITPPEGYEIDKKNSTFEKIVFKEIEQKLPMRWKDLKEVDGYYVTPGSQIIKEICRTANDYSRNTFPSQKEAEAALVLAQLCQLRNAWNSKRESTWKVNWCDAGQAKYCIIVRKGELFPIERYVFNATMYFKSRELRDEFMETFKDLLEEAKPFL